MKYIILILIILNFSCAKKQGERYVICEPYFALDSSGHRINKYNDKNTNQEVSLSDCDEVEVK